jgi:HD-GYP domain-containing protein (c-di-GMP phosphodiesterase class II)
MFATNIHQLLSAFSLALDVAENQTMEHAQRTAFIALQIANYLNLSNATKRDIYISALLHDIGVTSAKSDVHTDQSQIVTHCFMGAEIVKSLSFISTDVTENIIWHHAHWAGSDDFDRKGDEIPLGAQIIYLADQLDLQLRKLPSIYADRTSIQNYARENSKKLFNPEIVESFLAIQSKEKFWLDYATNNIKEDGLFRDYTYMLNLDGLEEIAAAFARIIDNKSPFTHRHSQGVAQLAAGVGQFYHFDAETIQKLKISGLLHDLGKLAVPNDILDKPGKLTPLEFQIVMGHAYYTKRILSTIHGFEDICAWAGDHHEAPNGTGYPQGVSGEGLSVQARIMAVCDVYQALTEERPYRLRPFTALEVNEIMNEHAARGRICPKALKMLQKMLE